MTLSALWAIVTSDLEQLLLELSDTFGQSISSQAASGAAEQILAEDMLSLNVAMSTIIETPMIQGAAIINSNAIVLAHAGSETFSDTATRIAPDSPASDLHAQGLYLTPIVFQDVLVGYALIHLDKSLISSSIQRSLQWMTITTLCILIFSLLLAIILGRHITRPLQHLTKATNALQHGNYEYQIPVKRQDELGSLIDGFNKMAIGLREREQLTSTFHRYLDSNIANNLLENLDNPQIPTRYVNASVLFIDIVGFTQMCELLAPNEIGELLNTYYHHTLQASGVYQGTVDKFIGDGVMIIFGAPDEDPHHSLNAICSALLFLKLVATYNEKRMQDNKPTIQFRLGIHCGEMLAGTLGTDVRMQYTVVGDPVNVAARLCGIGDPGKLVVSEKVYQHAGGSQTLLTQDQRFLEVRGKSSQISTYIVDGLKAPHASIVNQHAKDSHAEA
ncbi:hypothetical protein A9Q99_23475 [Gammaproteobacteria bacterium 45_16_T64]|nr:hypothetical protein A9Q99_23475 [Gammaproteobacteria bacterium 45_16_T64]